MTTALVLLSGGLDSVIALYAIRQRFHRVHAITFDYGQRNWGESHAARSVFNLFCSDHGEHTEVHIPKDIWVSRASILQGGAPVQGYASNEQAVKGTASDPAYLPLRNALFLTIAGHHLVGKLAPEGGSLVTGARTRQGGGAHGFPDDTLGSHVKLGVALSENAGVPIRVECPLNELPDTSRASTIRLAMTLQGCMDAISFSTSCFNGGMRPCMVCLPCTRRAAAFAEVGVDDPALVRLRSLP